MQSEDQVYQLPDSTGEELHRMKVWLAWFFGIATLLTILFIIYAPFLLKWVPFSAEKSFVRPYEEMAERWWNEESYPEIDIYLQELSDELSLAIDLPPEIEIQAHFLDIDEINAFAVLGGHIFITRGLLESVEDENSLSMVIAHEIAHQKHRDPIAGLSRGIAMQMIYSLITSDYNQLDLSVFGGELGLLYFSRDQEERADAAAIIALQQHYGHISGYDQFFREIVKMEASDDAQIPEWLSSHPDTENRIRILDDLKSENGWIQEQSHPLPENILQVLRSTSKTETNKGNK